MAHSVIGRQLGFHPGKEGSIPSWAIFGAIVQLARTLASQAGNPGSNPGGVIPPQQIATGAKLKSLWNWVRSNLFAFKVWMFFNFVSCSYLRDFTIIVLLLTLGVTFLGENPETTSNSAFLAIAALSTIILSIYRRDAEDRHSLFLSIRLSQEKDIRAGGLSNFIIKNGDIRISFNDIQRYVAVSTALAMIMNVIVIFNVDLLYTDSVFDQTKKMYIRTLHDMFWVFYFLIILPYNYFFHFMIRLSEMKTFPESYHEVKK